MGPKPKEYTIFTCRQTAWLRMYPYMDLVASQRRSIPSKPPVTTRLPSGVPGDHYFEDLRTRYDPYTGFLFHCYSRAT